METKIIGGANLTQKIREITSDKSAFVVSDSNVALTYGSLWQGAKHYIIPAGEGSKTLDMFGKIAKASWIAAATVRPRWWQSAAEWRATSPVSSRQPTCAE